MKKIIVSLSGGVDSAVTLAIAIDYGCEVQAVSFCYGSKHNQYENESAAVLAQFYKVPLKEIDLSSVMKGFCSNLMKDGGEIPEGHYESENMSKTVVPGRNIIFLSILSGLAWSINASEVWIGIHGGDHAIYPDCRPNFYYAMRKAIEAGTNERVDLIAPFLYQGKAYIIKKGIELGVPFRLTRTCYKNQGIACGKCGSCIERLEAFEANQMKDPIPYENS